ncbi:Mitogen-activated protein kinase [Kappamyces sp. JEL0680]|nr:Mitogen-activated protein kinase [Kappamyces sp. JEL0680]
MHAQFPPQITSRYCCRLEHGLCSNRYEIIKELGQGAYGYVCAARDKLSGREVAVKKVTKIFEKEIFAKRALRELKLLKHFNGHENITCILDMDLQNPADYNEIFLVQELMEADLHQIIRSQQSLTEQHYQFFVYQICKGLKYIHSANVLHRDLKPGNLLVNADCELKICDFGLARGFSDTPESNAGFMTEYVATRWYRAPEIMLSFKSYTKAIDMWSVGCIMAELLGGKPLFKGRDYVDQLNQILEVCGTPDDETLGRIGSERAQMYIRSLPKSPKKPFNTLFPNASPEARRISAEDALRHPWLEAYHEEDEELSHSEHFDFGFEKLSSIDELRMLISKEIMEYKASHPPPSRSGMLTVNAAVAGSLSPDRSSIVHDDVIDLDEELRMKGH